MTHLFRLTDRERELLERYYDFYKALALGSRKPTTEAQNHFVSVCHGEAEANTEHELAYMNFRKLVTLSRMTEKQVVDYKFGVAAVLQEEVEESEEAIEPEARNVEPLPAQDWSQIDEFGEGMPRPGWFTDDGWRRMRSGYRFDSRD